MTRSISWTIAFALAASLPACGGSDGAKGCDAPIAITQGTWCITINGTTNTCGSGVAPPYTGNLTRSGSNLSATSQNATYTGTLCGSSATMGTASNPSIVVHMDFTDPSHATGRTDWAVTGCSGTDTFTAHSGTCP